MILFIKIPKNRIIFILFKIFFNSVLKFKINTNQYIKTIEKLLKYLK